MKTLIVYDTVWGNTEQIARAIAEAIPGDVKLVKAGEADAASTGSFDMLLVGSPTQGGRPIKSVQAFIDSIPAGGLSKTGVAAFDTRTEITGGFIRFLTKMFGYAAPRLADALKNKGGQSAAPPGGFTVNGREGPLITGELERAAQWAKDLAAKTG